MRLHFREGQSDLRVIWSDMVRSSLSFKIISPPDSTPDMEKSKSTERYQKIKTLEFQDVKPLMDETYNALYLMQEFRHPQVKEIKMNSRFPREYALWRKRKTGIRNTIWKVTLGYYLCLLVLLSRFNRLTIGHLIVIGIKLN